MAKEIRVCKNPMTSKELTEMKDKGYDHYQTLIQKQYPHGNYWEYFNYKVKKERKPETSKNPTKK